MHERYVMPGTDLDMFLVLVWCLRLCASYAMSGVLTEGMRDQESASRTLMAEYINAVVSSRICLHTCYAMPGIVTERVAKPGIAHEVFRSRRPR